MAGFLHSERHRVAVLVRDGVLPMELGMVHQLFSAAVTAAGQPRYEVLSCAVHPGNLRTAADFTVDIAHGPELLAAADTVFVLASDQDYDPAADGRLPADLAAAMQRIPAGARVASICTGAFVLAGAGLLSGRRATTHWNAAERFRRRYPDVELDPNVLYVDAGCVLTSAGEAAGIDLCLYMIRCDYGDAVAREVARSTIVPIHREGGQAQFIRAPGAAPHESATASARTWALCHLDRPLSLRDLADQESTSVRTFTRHFRDETGLSPGQWLTQQRVERARQLLEDTDLPVDRVAEAAGFGTPAGMRQHFRARLGTSASAYRNAFRPDGPLNRSITVAE